MPAGFGVLNDIMETLRFRSTIFLRSQLAAPWGFRLEEEAAPRFHIAISGSFFVGDEGHSPPLEVGEMELALLPNGRSHWIADRPGRPLVPSAEAVEACELGSPFFQKGSVTNLVMCGVTRFDTDLSHPLLDTFPALIHIPKLEAESPVWKLVQIIDSEASQRTVLGGPILDRLTEALFLQLLQSLVDQDEELPGFFAALQDRQLHQALELIHRRPDKAWTIDDLASRVALSRATLVRRFRDSVGSPPIEYLTRWRLLKAHQLARHSADSIDRIASQVGFSSAQTLTRAFKRSFGITPTSLRR